MSGFIKLHRDLMDSQSFVHPITFKIWVWLLFKANYKDSQVGIWVGRGMTQVAVKRGQLLFGRHSAEEALNIDGSTIYKHIQKLQDWGNIIIESNNQYSLITICKYDTYQSSTFEEEHPNNSEVTTAEQQRSSSVTTAEHIKEEIRTIKKKEEGKEGGRADALPIPTLEEVIEFDKKEKIGADCAAFFYHYQSIGWMNGKNKIKNWQARLRNWKRNDDKWHPKKPDLRPEHNVGAKIDYSETERLIAERQNRKP